MRGIKEAVTAQEGYKLVEVRDMVDEVRRMREQLEEMKLHTISSPKLDSMPRGCGGGDAIPSALIREQGLEEQIARAERKLRRMQSATRRILKDLCVCKRMFYTAYYIDGEKQLQACARARISESTGYRYMRELERGI